MTSAEVFFAGLALLWGALVGLFYFGGLYWTLRRLSGKAAPRSFLGISYLVRTGVALLAFWLMLQRDVVGFLMTGVGFFLARFLVTRYVNAAAGKDDDGNQP